MSEVSNLIKAIELWKEKYGQALNYVQHTPLSYTGGCASLYKGPTKLKCDCGLDELLKKGA